MTKQFKLLLALVVFIVALAMPAHSADPPGMPADDNFVLVQSTDQIQHAAVLDTALTLVNDAYAEILDEGGGRCSIVTNFVRGDNYGFNRLGDRFALDGLRPIPAEATALVHWKGGGGSVSHTILSGDTVIELIPTVATVGARPRILNRRF